MDKIPNFILVLILMLSFSADGKGQDRERLMKKEPFGKTADGTPADIYTIRNRRGMEARITNYGGIVVSLFVPDKEGRFDDIVLGYDSLSGYIKGNTYFGGIIGRYGNRIAKGKFTLDGKEYTLTANNGPNHLHGGIVGFDRVVWKAEQKRMLSEQSLVLTYTSRDGEEGYPGNLSIKVVYSITEDNELRIEYFATTDKPTVVNLTHHSYFNLSGAGSGDILSHVLRIDADKFIPVDSGLIPTGELRDVRGTPMDFTEPAQIGSRVNANDVQLHLANGYDHTFVLNRTGPELGFAARATDNSSGRVMTIHTTEPGMQFYTGNFLDGRNIGKGGIAYAFRSGFCLETQHFPDSPNHPAFPSTTLRPGETYSSTTIYRFTTR